MKIRALLASFFVALFAVAFTAQATSVSAQVGQNAPITGPITFFGKMLYFVDGWYRPASLARLEAYKSNNPSAVVAVARPNRVGDYKLELFEKGVEYKLRIVDDRNVLFIKKIVGADVKNNTYNVIFVGDPRVTGTPSGTLQ